MPPKKAKGKQPSDAIETATEPRKRTAKVKSSAASAKTENMSPKKTKRKEPPPSKETATEPRKRRAPAKSTPASNKKDSNMSDSIPITLPSKDADSISSTPQELSIPYTSDKPINCLIWNTPPTTNTAPHLIFTHGASGTLASPGMANFSTGYSSTTSPLLCFQGTMNLSSRTKMFRSVLSHQYPNGLGGSSEAVALGGRSMGARAAVMASSDHSEIRSLVLVSYPLHTAKDTRDRILLDVGSETQVLFIIGSKDGMCDIGRLEKVREKMQARSWLVVVDGAGHGMDVVPKRGTKGVGEMTGRVASEWVGGDRGGKKRRGRIGWDNETGEAVWSGWS